MTTRILIFILPYILAYLFGSFIWMSFDANNWGQSTRFMLMFIAMATSIMTFIIPVKEIRAYYD